MIENDFCKSSSDLVKKKSSSEFESLKTTMAGQSWSSLIPSSIIFRFMSCIYVFPKRLNNPESE